MTMAESAAKVGEHLKTVVGHIENNVKQIENQLMQLGQQKGVLEEQLTTAKSLLATIYHAMENGLEEQVFHRLERLVKAQAEVASSPSQPAAAANDAATAGAPKA
jgi:flagellar biosynthesis chaperone FliJ